MRSVTFVGILALFLCASAASQQPASWSGVVRDATGDPLSGATVELRAVENGGESPSAPVSAAATLTRTTGEQGTFNFSPLPPGSYTVRVEWRGRSVELEKPLEVHEGERIDAELGLLQDSQQLSLRPAAATPAGKAGGGAELTGKQVSSLPLNKRDFSQLLLLAAGTMTDTNGAANFTQQFAVNGQRGTTAVFSMDGVDITDPSLGGATFANFNVDAIEEIRSDTGVMLATIGHGAAGFTNVITKRGTAALHGSAFEFVRNAALDARNFFDRRSLASPGRIPPFVRNEFGLTSGGPLILPGLYDGRQRTFCFAEYQGFRQVLGTTQVFPVPTNAERGGVDTTAFAGDTLTVPVNPAIAAVLARYPLPNDPGGAFGARTYATSSKVATRSDQFSFRLDHRLSEKSQLLGRFTFNDTAGPTVNPDQTALDPSFGTHFLDHQRNLGLLYTRTVSPLVTWVSSISYLRSTPLFASPNSTQPGFGFSDGLYESFNGAAGGGFGVFANLFQLRQDFTYARGGHALQFGGEVRFDRDTGIFGLEPNGLYRFGDGTAYSPVNIPSSSGLHNVRIGDALPDTLSGLLTASPFSYTASVAYPLFPQGKLIGENAVRREAYNFYFQDTWKARPRLTLNLGLRYEINTRMREAHHLTSGTVIVGSNGEPAHFWELGATLKYRVNLQPAYRRDLGGWGPRLAVEWRASDRTTLRAAGGLTTNLPNLFQADAISGGFPFVYNPYLTAAPTQPVPFQAGIRQIVLPTVFTPAGQAVFATGRSTDVAPNTEIDIQRFENDLAAMTPGNQIQPLLVFNLSRDFVNGYIETYTAGITRELGDITLDISYVGTSGVKLLSVGFPNRYPGADPPFAPFTRFDLAGNVTGGFGPEFLIGSRSHSTYHALQAALSKTSPRAGLGFQASYTLSKSLDDSSNPFGGLGSGSSGTVLQPPPQDPWDPGREKGPSTFDIRHVAVFSLIQILPFDRVAWLRPLGRRAMSGWQFLNITALTSGPPFTVLSGIQQTGAGSFGGDRPDQVEQPVFSTSRNVREDYFGRGDANVNFFSIPIGVPGGTGPNRGRFGTLGRNTFRGAAFRNYDFAVIKDTALLSRGGHEAGTLEFRGEFFNAFNLVNFGLPANILRGTGFGSISRTAGSSRQIQFSLKLIY